MFTDVVWSAFVHLESSYEDWISGRLSRVFQSSFERSDKDILGAEYLSVEDQSPVTGPVVKGTLSLLKWRDLTFEGAPITLMGTVALRSPSMCKAGPLT